MSDTAHATALSRLAAPRLQDLLPRTVQRWAANFGNVPLAREILTNPRLEQRVLATILDTANAPEAPDMDVLAASDDAVALELILQGYKETLILMVGMMWHRPAILEWITWAKLDTHLPGIHLTIARAAVTGADPALLTAAGAPDVPAGDLSDAILREDGAFLLASWAGTLEPDLLNRLQLFVDLEADPGEAHYAALIRNAAQILYDLEAS